MLYVRFENDSRGDLVDIEYYCSASCAPSDAGAWPGGMETDYDQHCSNCGDLIREVEAADAHEEEGCDG